MLAPIPDTPVEDHSPQANGAVKVKQLWDTKTQQFHGGQEWQFLDNFVEDFSVTTNGLGTPEKALQAARDALNVCHHYPPADQEPAKTHLATFMWPEDVEDVHSRILLGNGASELIDLVTRAAPEGPWKPGPWNIQYKEYERSAIALGREVLRPDQSTPAALTCIVNPNNPTGDYMPIEELKAYIERTTADNTVVMVDESMQPWHSPEYRFDSLISQGAWMKEMYATRGIAVFLMHSWTKLWSCTGLRLGSVVCPTVEHATKLKKVQVPWSVNLPALKFLEVVTSGAEQEYLDETWTVTTEWRAHLVERLNAISNNTWSIEGKPFLSWVWIDMKSQKIAEEAVARAKFAGVPVRSGKPGYGCETCVRAAVRNPQQVEVLIRAWQGLVV
ncbi:pyridoxal phosphate-dependent transferase [Phlyctochytrium arcticum]|nr:pyridoxal phosphate-dependent transferase [Phlyctochytrium arcticum]